MSIDDACLHTLAAIGWQQYYLTLAQQLSLLFVNTLNCVKFTTKICTAPNSNSCWVTVSVTLTAVVQLLHMYDSFGDLNRIQLQYHTPPWKV